MEELVRSWVAVANSYVVNLCQILAMVVITIGVLKGMLIFTKDALFGDNSSEAIQESRMEVGHAFSLGLSFLIGGSILNTTIAPTWTIIGQLAAVIAIRTVLNHFLLRDISGNRPIKKKGANAKGGSSESPKPASEDEVQD